MIKGAEKGRIAVAMSGGVDSSVAAALLCRAGYRVFGVTLCFSLPERLDGKTSCCGATAIQDAKNVCGILGIPHYVLEFGKILEKMVIEDFCREYAAGRTPNPCILCNERVKFDALLKNVLAAGADYLATGHYARLDSIGNSILRKAVDGKKDQSYFLYRLTPDRMKYLIFPLGTIRKVEVRRLAKEFGLPVAGKRESQDICFLSSDGYRKFIQSRYPGACTPGPVTDDRGNVLGTHPGIAFFTVGQRRGLGISTGRPYYVREIRPAENRIIAGPRECLQSREFIAEDTVFHEELPGSALTCKVKVRHKHPPAEAEACFDGKNLRVIFRKAQFAITPGQSAVLYQGDRVLGGGVISSVVR